MIDISQYFFFDLYMTDSQDDDNYFSQGDDNYCSPGEGLYCNNDPVQSCKLCNTWTCKEHSGNSEHCKNCAKIMQRIDETKQKPDQCYFARCQVKPIARCGFCKRRLCHLHKMQQDCLRCFKAKKKLQISLKEDDKSERDDSQKAAKLSPDLFKSYLMAKIYGDSSGFWYLYYTKKI
jgi:hypothetical protein